MDGLPNELLKLIVDEVPVGADLGTVRALNSTFCALATPRVFQTFQASNTVARAQAFENILLCSAAIPHIQEIVFRDIFSDADGNTMKGACFFKGPRSDCSITPPAAQTGRATKSRWSLCATTGRSA